MKPLAWKHITVSLCLIAAALCASLTGAAQNAETPTATPTLAPTMTPAPTFTPAPTPRPGEPTHTPFPTATMAPTSTPVVEMPTAVPTATATPIANRPPKVAASRARIHVGNDDKARFLVGAEDPDGDSVSVTVSPESAGEFVSSTKIGRFLTGTFEVDGSTLPLGVTTITFIFTDDGAPNESAVLTVSVIVQQRDFDEAIIAQGYGGRTNVTYRTVDLRADLDRDGSLSIRDLLGIVASWNAMPAAYEAIVGGGTDRVVHLAVGDINNDGVEELVTTFGPVTRAAASNSANMFILRNDRGRVLFPPFGAVFAANKPGETVNNPMGEMVAAVGDFIGSSTNKQIAFAQGLGGNGVIRIMQYTGANDFLSPLNSWSFVAQLYGTSVPSLNIDSTLALSDEFSNAMAQNANGGVSLAAADLDGDGLDELIVGQTSSPTSRGTIQVLDLGEPNPQVANVVFDAQYVEYNAFDVLEPFLGDFRGDGGVNIAAADLDGDAKPEVILTSQGDSAQTASVKNWVLILRPTVAANRVTGFSIVGGGLLGAFTEPAGSNTSNAVSVGTGEFSGLAGDGKEIIVGTQAIVDYDGFNATVSLKPDSSQYMILKANFSDDGLSVSGASNLIFTGRAEGFSAFQGSFEPSSSSINVAGFNALDLDDL